MSDITQQLKLYLEVFQKRAEALWSEWQPLIEQKVDKLGGDLPEELKDLLKSPLTYLALAIFVLILLLSGILSLLTPKKKRNAVLLVGPCDAGKTAMFYQLRDGIHRGTVSSMVANQGTFSLHSEKVKTRPVNIIDVPGHPRVRGTFEQYIGKAKGIVFLVDSLNFLGQKTDAAEQLMEVLTHPVVSRNRLPVLIACNKADDKTRANTPDFIRKQLEKELDKIRGTRSALDDGTRGRTTQIGRPGETFTFDSHAKSHGVKVQLTTCSALQLDSLKEVEEFIRKCVPA